MNQSKTLADALSEIIREQDGKRKLDCKDAHQLAAQSSWTLAEIGAYCNAENIRISHCELGCF